MGIFDSPTTEDSVYADTLYVLNCCGMVFRPDHSRVVERPRSDIDGKQAYYNDRCPCCNERRPALVIVEERWGTESTDK